MMNIVIFLNAWISFYIFDGVDMMVELLGGWCGQGWETGVIDEWCSCTFNLAGWGRFSRRVFRRIVMIQRWRRSGTRHSTSICFTDNSVTYVDVSYMLYFRDLELMSNYAWREAAITHLYKDHNNSSHYKTKHLAGYLNLLHVYIIIDCLFINLHSCFAHS